MSQMQNIPTISNYQNNDNKLTFTLYGVDVSFANSIRRTILADIKTVVFRTTPYEENQANITINTTRLNNEILKQRLSCTPIHITNISKEELDNLVLEVDQENLTESMMVVTTEHFKVKNKRTNSYLSKKDSQTIFPPYIAPNGVEYFVEFVRLRPKISEDILGEKIKFTCNFSIGTAKENCMFNVVGTCAYGFTVDNDQAKAELTAKQQQWQSEHMTPENIDYESKNWLLLEAKRYTIKNSFDFVLESVGVFENETIVRIACQVLIDKFQGLIREIDEGKFKINLMVTKTPNTFDYILTNEDYTIGTVLNHLLYKNYFEGIGSILYCGFKKMHPHDTDSIIRLTFKMEEQPSTGLEYIKACSMEAIGVFDSIMKKFRADADIQGYNIPDVEMRAREPATPAKKVSQRKQKEEEIDFDIEEDEAS
jgi:DNA-directed RNA polymerase II subunit RPB3